MLDDLWDALIISSTNAFNKRSLIHEVRKAANSLIELEKENSIEIFEDTLFDLLKINNDRASYILRILAVEKLFICLQKTGYSKETIDAR